MLVTRHNDVNSRLELTACHVVFINNRSLFPCVLLSEKKHKNALHPYNKNAIIPSGYYFILTQPTPDLPYRPVHCAAWRQQAVFPCNEPGDGKTTIRFVAAIIPRIITALPLCPTLSTKGVFHAPHRSIFRYYAQKIDDIFISEA